MVGERPQWGGKRTSSARKDSLVDFPRHQLGYLMLEGHEVGIVGRERRSDSIRLIMFVSNLDTHSKVTPSVCRYDLHFQNEIVFFLHVVAPLSRKRPVRRDWVCVQ